MLLLFCKEAIQKICKTQNKTTLIESFYLGLQEIIPLHVLYWKFCEIFQISFSIVHQLKAAICKCSSKYVFLKITQNPATWH